jgi:transposase-like protein
MSKSTISTFQLFERFPDKESARVYLESRLWPNGVVCPVCKAGERITARKAGYYRCNACSEDFTVRTGTVMERSHIPLHKWLYAMYLLVTARKGISSMQLAKEIGVTQKSAWFMLHRLREACGGRNLTKLKGIIEIDECFVGGLEGNKHENKKLHAGRGPVGKTAVLGMRERGGRTQACVSQQMTYDEVHGSIHEAVEMGSTLYTDDHGIFENLDGLFYRHETINHTIGEYARGPVSTNSIESVWAVLKRGIMGVYHKVSVKHLGRYVDEFAFRLNEGNVKIHTLDRLDSFVDGMAGKRLTYAGLIQ